MDSSRPRAQISVGAASYLALPFGQISEPSARSDQAEKKGRYTWSGIGIGTLKLGVSSRSTPSILANSTSKVDELDLR
jgi:hypothetical protein